MKFPVAYAILRQAGTWHHSYFSSRLIETTIGLGYSANTVEDKLNIDDLKQFIMSVDTYINLFHKLFEFSYTIISENDLNDSMSDYSESLMETVPGVSGLIDLTQND